MIAVLGRGLIALGALVSAVAVVRAPSVPPGPSARETACLADPDCRYDPKSDVCDSDPRSNRQPPLLDQGIVNGKIARPEFLGKIPRLPDRSPLLTLYVHPRSAPAMAVANPQ